LAARLCRIHLAIRELLLEHAPGAVSLEKAFVSRNVQSAFRLGEARGAVLIAAADCGVEVFEYSPAAIKQSVVGYGRADKDQIVRGVSLLLSLSDLRRADEADALAAAVCHLRGASWRLAVGRAR
jgi:crossover junction endodeoxyribonuclease RuvC